VAINGMKPAPTTKHVNTHIQAGLMLLTASLVFDFLWGKKREVSENVHVTCEKS